MRGFGENRTKKGREKYWQLVTICYQLKGRGTFCPTPLPKKEALSGFLEVGVLFAEDVGDPEATDVVAQGLSTHQSEAILFTYMLKLYCNIIAHISFVVFIF